MKNIKRCMSLVLVFLFLLSSPATIAHAEEAQLLTRDDILEMSKSELLSTLKDNGLLLPEDYATHTELAENFVFKHTPLIIEGTVDSDTHLFNYDQSNEMLSNPGITLADLGLVTNSARLVRSTYTLQKSTAIGSWENSYKFYNC